MCETSRHEKVLVMAKSRSHAKYLCESFDREVAVRIVDSPEVLVSALEGDPEITIVIIDVTNQWDPRQLCEFGALSLMEMEEKLETGGRPVCFGLLEQIKAIRQAGRPDLLIVVHWPYSGMYVTEKLLYFGADWVWPDLRVEWLAQALAWVRRMEEKRREEGE